MTGKVDALEKVLVLNLGNRATYAQWRDEMVRVTLPKRTRGLARRGRGFPRRRSTGECR